MSENEVKNDIEKATEVLEETFNSLSEERKTDLEKAVSNLEKVLGDKLGESEVETEIEEPFNPDEVFTDLLGPEPVTLDAFGEFEALDRLKETSEVDDKDKTPAQILAEAGVTQEELDRVFPPDYTPLKSHPGKLEDGKKEDFEAIIERNKEVKTRVQQQAKNPDSQKMPPQKHINDKYEGSIPEKFKIGGDEGANVTLDGLLAMIENGKHELFQRPSTEDVRKTVVEEVRKTINDFIELSELEKFDAKQARKLWLQKIQVHSRMKTILNHIKDCAASGKSNTQIDYLTQYDKIKLNELGFALQKMSGQTLSYTISWESAK